MTDQPRETSESTALLAGRNEKTPTSQTPKSNSGTPTAAHKKCILLECRDHFRPECDKVRRVIWMAYALGVVTLALWCVLLATGTARCDHLHALEDFAEVCSLDVLVVDVGRSVAVGIFLWIRDAELASFAGSFALIMNIGKLWTFRNWTSPGHASVVILSLLASVAHSCLSLFLDKPGSFSKVNKRAVWKIAKPYFWPKGLRCKAIVGVMWLSLFAVKGSAIAIPIVLQKIVNCLSETPASDDAMYWLTLFFGLTLAVKLLSEAKDVMYCHVWCEAFSESSDVAFRHFHGLPHKEQSKLKLGTAIDAFREGIESADNLVYNLCVCLIPALWTGAAAFIIFVAHFKQPLIAGVSFVGFGLYIWVTYVLTTRKGELRDEIMETMSKHVNFITDSFSNFASVKQFNNIEHEATRFKQYVDEFRHTYIKVRTSHTSIDFCQTFISSTSLYLVMLIVCLAITERFQKDYGGDKMNVATFVALQAFLVAIFAPLTELGRIYMTIIISLMNLQDLSEILALETEDLKGDKRRKLLKKKGLKERQRPDINSGIESSDSSDEDVAAILSKPLVDLTKLKTKSRICKTVSVRRVDPSTGNEVISKEEICFMHAKGLAVGFENVTFTYPGQTRPALKNVSFIVPAGNTTAIVGSSGSGKSTIAKLVMRLYSLRCEHAVALQIDGYSVSHQNSAIQAVPADVGHITIGGHSVLHSTLESIREVVGVVPQDLSLFDDTILNNILYASKNATKEDAINAGVRAQLNHLADTLPDHWDTRVGEHGAQLSGGERQRIALARICLKDPPIVILDEATSALDTKTEKEVLDIMLSQFSGKGRTTIMVAHRLSTVKTADEILVMHNGEIVERGVHDDLLSRNGRYAELWRAQEEEIGVVSEDN